MPRQVPQFRARVKITFEDHGAERQRKFGFDENGHRRLPMNMEGVDGLHTVGLWIEKPNAVFHEEDEFNAECRVIWPEGFVKIVVPGVQFKLWDSGFIARGVVTERCEEGWKLQA